LYLRGPSGGLDADRHQHRDDGAQRIDPHAERRDQAHASLGVAEYIEGGVAGEFGNVREREIGRGHVGKRNDAIK
jgi:hypothetical protein